jgi:hypothetical protein
VTDDDQPRPDLDAAIDAVLPSLTALGEAVIAGSLRRTRVALAANDGATPRAAAWGWGAAAAVLIVLASTLALWRDRAPEAPPVAAHRAAASPAEAKTRAHATPQKPARVEATPSRRVRATSVPPTAPPTPTPDPLIALVRAVQDIPDETWTAAVARAEAPVAVLDLSIAPIVLAPLETPPIVDTPVEPLAPGEP